MLVFYRCVISGPWPCEGYRVEFPDFAFMGELSWTMVPLRKMAGPASTKLILAILAECARQELTLPMPSSERDLKDQAHRDTPPTLDFDVELVCGCIEKGDAYNTGEALS